MKKITSDISKSPFPTSPFIEVHLYGTKQRRSKTPPLIEVALYPKYRDTFSMYLVIFPIFRYFPIFFHFINIIETIGNIEILEKYREFSKY